jgi:YYY domain-containing protein
MLSFLYWYFLITLLGLLAFPLTYKLLPGLADRGYAVARALGLLIWGYLFWLLGSLGLLENDTPAEIFTLVLLAAFGYLFWRSLDKVQLRNWFYQQRRMILVVEVLFLFAFLGWALIRSASPDIVGTEKPMELAFINAILRSPTLPPHDPWLSGHTISYYYFGYVMVAMLARLTGTLGGVAFNLGIALVFALSAIGAYGILYNMLSVRQQRDNSSNVSGSPFSALIGPFFVLIVSNLSGVLYLMHINGVFWWKNEAGEWASSFWSWLDIGSFSEPPVKAAFSHWWWWQGSRIVQDYDYLWNKKAGVIDEFPFFSFLLADLHPHVLVLPFGFLAMALALNLCIGGCLGRARRLWVRLDVKILAYGLTAFVLGALSFLNTWDFPFYVALFAGVYMLKRLHDNERTYAGFEPSLTESARDFTLMGLSLAAIGGLAFVPFYQSFSSQAGGLLPNLIYITKGVYQWIMFAPILIPVFAFLIYLWKQHGDQQRLITGIKVSLILLAILLLMASMMTALLYRGIIFEGINAQAAVISKSFLSSLQAPGFQQLINEGIARRIRTPGTLLTLMPIVIMVIGLLWPGRNTHSADPGLQSRSTAHTFTLLLILMGAMLILIPEFFYLRDFFGYRINTIFKFYFLAWVVWSIAAAYGVIEVWKGSSGIWGVIFKTISLTVLFMALLYPAMGLWTRTSGFEPHEWRLDGTAHLKRRNPHEAAAIQWLREAPVGIVAESIGGSYTAHARFATHSGQPTVLGWVGHEQQWRGGFVEIGSREQDIARLYCSSQWQEARTILQQYNIRYIVVGELERKTYVPATRSCAKGLNEAKFVQYLTPAFQQSNVTIYEVL